MHQAHAHLSILHIYIKYLHKYYTHTHIKCPRQAIENTYESNFGWYNDSHWK